MVKQLSNFYEVHIDNCLVGYIFKKNDKQWIILSPSCEMMGRHKSYNDAYAYFHK